MYLKTIYIQNNGPLTHIDIELPFNDRNNPIPIVLLGQNGSGKTNFLSIVADALIQAAAVHYQDVVPLDSYGRTPFFRVVGATTITAGQNGGCVLLHFDHDNQRLIFREKAGFLNSAETLAKAPEVFRALDQWDDEGNSKTFSISDDVSKEVFEKGSYLYFPSSRSETPHWLNTDSIRRSEFDLGGRYEKLLQKPIYVESGLQELKRWILALLVEVRVDFDIVEGAEQVVVHNVRAANIHKQLWQALNQILRIILDDSRARFVWTGRNSPSRIGYIYGGSSTALPIDNLSTGQSTLLNIFGTLLRCGDIILSANPNLDQLKGICVIDEIDSHMHIDLQFRAIPRLLGLFPRIQFIMSSHSPLFVIGLEKRMGNDGVYLLDMPSANRIEAETYAEFGKALEVLQETKEFASRVIAEAGKSGKLLVFLEGETDPLYLMAAAEVLNRADLLDKVEFHWVGAKDSQTGQGYNTGKDALNQTLTVLKANPQLVKRKILLLYDNDSNKSPQSFGMIEVRSLPSNPKNTIILNGIENLLPPKELVPEMFDEKITSKPNATTITTRSLNKMRLCNFITESRRERETFASFEEVLNIVSDSI
jgi:hypothetical protein